MNEEDYSGIERRNDKAASYDKPILDAIEFRRVWDNMKHKIHRVWEESEYNFDSEAFLDCIWEVSTEDLPGLEVSVVVDANNKLFIGKGTGSFVDYKSENVTGMMIPLKCWIHTHPFGAAYFSGTDWFTINTQRPILNSAIVLGNMERMKWYKNREGEEILCRMESTTMKELKGEEE